MRDVLNTDLSRLWSRLHWAIQLPFVLAALLALLFLCALVVIVLVVAFERSIATGIGLILFTVAFTFLVLWLDRPKRPRYPDDYRDDDDDPGAGGVPMRLKPPPPTLHARDAKDMDQVNVAS